MIIIIVLGVRCVNLNHIPYYKHNEPESKQINIHVHIMKNIMYTYSPFI